MHTKRTVFGLLLAIGLAATACGGSANNGASPVDEGDVSETEAADSSRETETADEAEPVEEQPAEEVEQQAEESPEEEVDEEQTEPQVEPVLFTEVLGPLEVDKTYRSEETGVPFTFTLEEEWWVQINSPGQVVLTDPAAEAPGDRDVWFLRPSALADPSQPGADRDIQQDWPLDDIEGWVDNLIDGIETSEPEMVELGGRQAVRFTAEVTDERICGETVCAEFVTNNLVRGRSFDPGTTSTIYWVDMGDAAPLAVIIGSPSTDDQWLDTAEAMLATVEFGEPGPHPIDADAGPLWEQGISFDVPAGVQRFPSFDGIQIDLPEDRFVVQEGPNIMRIFPDEEIPAVVEVIKADAGTDGTSIATADDLVVAMEGCLLYTSPSPRDRG